MRIGILYFWAHQYDQAIPQIKMINEMLPNFPNPYTWPGFCYLEKKDYGKATDALQRAVTLSDRAPVALAGLGIVAARGGRMREAESILNELLQSSKTRCVPEFYMACLYAAPGRKEEAFEWLEKSYQERSNALAAIRPE